ncbi:unnamed protein product [Hermetia illucens]|uniref:N-acetyltransferase domain-containing protein n=1 Tax=Hermetia illucens TaxID=343691 RepID=A0A7R8YTY4_HERIL|nr:uncharacterized protein LOC119651488 [Hermetia illucens]CAD7084904.1 unnamed protein product [Hermetia illucens]
MSSFIVIRPKRKEDDLKCEELMRNYVMSFAWKTFLSCIFKEITIEAIIISWAVLFIFFGVPIAYCTLSIPACLLVVLMIVYALCLMKASECCKIRCKEIWVAEAYEPLLDFNSSKDRTYLIFYDHSPYDAVYENKFRKTIAGVIGLDTHNALYKSGFITGLAVAPNYKFNVVAEALITQAMKTSCEYKYINLESVTNVWQETERDTYYKLGFATRQIYHKPIHGTSMNVQKCQLGLNVAEWKSSQANAIGNGWQ